RTVGSDDAELQFMFYGSWLYYNFEYEEGNSPVDVYVDGVFVQRVLQYDPVAPTQFALLGRFRKGVHYCRLVRGDSSLVMTFKSMRVLKTKNEYIV
ncbi:MAG: hypothetical protein ACOYYJ_05645, partial [Chloroflexota bacterium]